MSSEEEASQEELEYQNTQKEIEELRQREEELMMKINALEKKQRFTPDDSLEDRKNENEGFVSDQDSEEHEQLGKKRRPSLSRGSPKTSELTYHRPKSLELEKEAATFRSRPSRSPNTSPTKDDRDSTSSSSKKLSSPTKERVYSSRSTISIRQSSSSTTSDKKSPNSNSSRVEISTSSAIPAAKESKASYRSQSKMIRSYSATSSEKSPRSSAVNQSKSTKSRKLQNRRSFPAAEDNGGDVDIKRAEKSYSTTNLSKVKVPENKLIDRQTKNSRDSSKDGNSRGSLKLNEDSYEIIEIDAEELDLSPNEDNTSISARERIEKELLEQRQREEELKISQRLSFSSRNDEEINSIDEYNANDESPEGEEDSDDTKGGRMEGETQTLSTWEKIALEIEEEKRRDEELKRKKMEESDEGSEIGEDESLSEEDVASDISKKITLEIEEQKRREKELRKLPRDEEEQASEEESNEDTKVKGLSVQDRIELEIKEIEKRESELKKVHNLEQQEDILEEEEEVDKPARDTGTKSKIQQEIDEFKKKESEFRKLHGVDEGDVSEDEDSGDNRFSSMSVIERELVEQKKKEREFRRQHKEELQNEREGMDGNESSYDDDEEEIPEDESILIEKSKRKVNGKGQSSGKVENNEKREFAVERGIARKYIHLFDKGAERSEETRRGPRKFHRDSSNERPKSNGQNHEYEGTNGGKLESTESPSMENEDENKEDEVDNSEIEKEAFAMKEENNATEIQRPSPGKKLVLKKKKLKDRKQEQYHNEINEKSHASMKGNSGFGSKVRITI